MTDLASVRQQLDFERRTFAEEILPNISRSGDMISFSSLSDTIADAVITEQAAHYRALGTAVEWKVYQHDTPGDLLERIERHGFEIGPCETVLILDLHDRPSWIDEPSHHQVVCLENATQVNLFRSATEEIFKKSRESTANALLSAITKGSTHHRGYMIMDQGIAVSVGRLLTDPKSVFGGLYGGGTLEQYRGRGLYRSTVAARARDAAKFGARYLLVDALPTSRPILERLGFVRLTDTWPCTLKL